MVLSYSYALQISSVTFEATGPNITTTDFETTNGTDFNLNTGSANPLSLQSLIADDGSVSGLQYNILDLPFDVTLQRSAADTTSNIQFFITGGAGTDANPYDVAGELSITMEEAYNSRNLAVGVENMFSNSGSTDKNVERVDYIYSGGITARAAEGQDTDEYGFAFFERDANNNFGIAAITGIDGDNNVTSFGDLIMFGENDVTGGDTDLNWGPDNLGGSLTNNGNFAILNGDTSDTSFDDFSFASTGTGQDIGGVFITFEELGLSQDQTIFGYAIFAGDQDDKNGGNAPSGATINDFDNDSVYEQSSAAGIDTGGDLYGGGVIFQLDGGPPTSILDPEGFYWDLNGSRAGATDDVENGGLTEAQQDAQLTDIWTNNASDNHWGSKNGGIETNGWADNKVAIFAAGSTDATNTRDAQNNTYTATVQNDLVKANGIRVEDGNLTIDSSGGGGIELNTVSTEVPFIEVQNNTGDIKTRANGRATKISAPISGTAGIRKLGDGDLILRGNNTVSGTYSQEAGNTELNSVNALGGINTIDLQTGTLFLNATNAINDTGNMVLNGGNITVVDNFDHSDTLGTLTLNEDSIIDMGTRPVGQESIINFADSESVAWVGDKQWSIVNWSGIGSTDPNASYDAGVNGPGINGGGGRDQIYFGNSNTGLTTTQLQQIKFINPEGYAPGTYAAIILADGEIVPLVPEAQTVIALVALLFWALLYRRKRWSHVSVAG
ncbi:MAG: hypothetical protein AAF571_04490 [Verrucomicrobiota bacterium]